MNVWAKSPALGEPAKSCSEPKVLERRGVVVITQPLFWLTSAERSVILRQVTKYRRCVATVTIDRKLNHMHITWKEME